jgi:ribosomal protein S18 acetylase RimI-like enzyme
MKIRTYEASDQADVIALWRACDLMRPWNDPAKDIARKMALGDALFLVGVLDDAVVGTVMAGYEGHRGWVNYLAVDLGARHAGLGRQLMDEAERRLRVCGCPKINLQIRTSNLGAVAFYERLGYVTDDVVSMGKRVDDDH